MDALAAGADVVIIGRAADPAIFVPLIVEFGWAMDAWTSLGRGTLIGYLLECAGQITGGYFADPGAKDVSNLARLGFPIGEVREDGEVVVTKVAGSGGAVTARTVKEQLLYEIHNPKTYFQPDVVADFSEVRVEEIGPDRVRVTGGKGAPKTGLLKTSVGSPAQSARSPTNSRRHRSDDARFSASQPTLHESQSSRRPRPVPASVDSRSNQRGRARGRGVCPLEPMEHRGGVQGW